MIDGAATASSGEKYDFSISSSRTITDCSAVIKNDETVSQKIEWTSQTDTLWEGYISIAEGEEGTRLFINAYDEGPCHTEKNVGINE